MTAFSLGTVWEETIAFLRRESGLLIPVALAIYGPAQWLMDIGLQKVVAIRAATDAAAPPPPEMLLALPGGLLMLLGNLVITLLVVMPGISVGEALAGGVRRLASALGAILLLGAAITLGMLGLIIVASLGAVAMGGGANPVMVASQFVMLAMIPVSILWLRLLLLPTVAAVEPLSPVELIRRAWELSRGNAMRLLGAWVLLIFLSVFLALIEMLVVGSLVELLKRGLGDEGLPNAIQAVVSAGLGALLSMGFAVYLALVYRTLTAR